MRDAEERPVAKAVGIDLGTTNSVIATVEGGQPTVIPNAEGSRTTPSVVAFTDQGERLVGQLARRQAILNPKGTIYSAKRFIGRRYDEVHERGQRGHLRRRRRARRRRPASTSAGKLYAPEEISALVLRKLAEDAGEVPRREGHRGGHHRAGVLQRRPAAGDQGRRPDRRPRGAAHHQRADRGRAGLRPRQEVERDRAGLRPRRRHLRRQHPRRRRRRRRGARRPSGDTHLGGDDFDRRLVDHLADEFQKEQRHRPAQGPAGAAAAVRGGREGQGRAVVGDPDPGQPAVHHRRRQRARSTSTTTIMRSTFEEITADLVERCLGRSSRRWPTPRSRPTTSTRSSWSAARPASRPCRAWCAG